MKKLHSILAGLALAAVSAPGWAFELPVSDDGFGTTASAKVTKTGSTATNLAVSARSNSFLTFGLGSFPGPASSITHARLILFVSKVTKPGTLSVKTATVFTESTTTAVAPAIGDVIKTAVIAADDNKHFIFIDVTGDVQSATGSDIGYALTGDAVLNVLIGAKEGSGSGYPAVLEIEANPSGGTVTGATVTASGAITGGSGAFGGNVVVDGGGNLTVEGGGSLTLQGTTGSISMGGVLDCEGKISSFATGLAINVPTGDLKVGGSASRITLNAAAASGTAATIQAVAAEGLIMQLKTNAGATIGQFQDPTGNGASLLLFNGVGAQPGGGSWANSSDRRLKKNIEPLSGALDRLLQLRSVTYEYRDPAAIHEPTGTQIGFIAQEVEPIFPGWVGEKEDGMKYLAVKGFESLTVQALRELRTEKDAEIAALRQKLAALEKAAAARQTLDAALQARLTRLESALPAVPAPALTAALERQ